MSDNNKRNPNLNKPSDGGNRGTPAKGMGPGGGRGPGGGGFRGTDKAKDFKGTIKKLTVYLGKYKLAIILIAIFAVASSVFAIVGPSVLGQATTELYNGMMETITNTGDGINMDAIARILLTLLGLYVVSMLFSLMQGLIMTKVANNITYKMRNEVSDKIHKLPFSYFHKSSVGDVLSRLTNDVDMINQGFNQGITQIITSVTSIVGIIIMMFSISWQMTIIAFITIPISLVSVIGVAKKSQKFFIRQQQYLGSVNGIVEENYSCHTIVKAFNAEDKAIKEFEDQNAKLYESAWKANFLSGLMMPLMTVIGNFGYVLVCILGGYLAATGAITVGNIQAFIQYVRRFNQPIAQLSQISNILQQTVAASERVFEFLAEGEESPDKENAIKVNIGNEKQQNAITPEGRVEFENVQFGYDPEKIIINNFSANIKSGQKIAIVGPTGAGKTTVVKLLMRFYDVNSGKILVDGHDIKDFKREELRKAFGMVLQETWLFCGSIKENIRYGKLGASDEEVKRAAEIAQCHHFIETMPAGYDLELNEDATNVSQGQKQLLTIARAVLADPKILILDEATSSVDTRTELLIQKAMDNLMQNRTSFIIAHRLSTIKNADLILVMDKGNIIEQGSHDELLAENGFYANLYNSQFTKVS